tara:strand:+ start:1527 stop:1910 length:384 start_codon:yes stop_codon:yes gene_type:complete
MNVGHIHVAGRCERVAPVLARIGDKWAVLVVILLADGPVRFNELKRRIDVISQRMLTFTLRALERDGLVTRTVYASVPPKVEYALTPLGVSLLDPISHLSRWAVDHADEMEAAREAFDGEKAREAAE